MHVTSSIGVSCYPNDGLDAEALIKNADTAMYQAKENGRHRYAFVTPVMSIRATGRQSIEAGLRTALQRHAVRNCRGGHPPKTSSASKAVGECE